MTQAHREQDPDFATEHDSLTASGQDTGGPEEAPEPESPTGYGGMDLAEREPGAEPEPAGAEPGSGQADGEQRASRSYAAPAEVVYDTATDPHQLPRWLPSDLRLSVLNNDLIQVTRGQVDVAEYRISVDRAQHSVSWQPIGPAGWEGALRVRPAPGGGSTAELSLRAADAERAEEDLSAVMEATLRRLEQLIPQR